ncbi:uncharacterized protein CC84DRAFT_91151 [Paraphaeosphaeria sporulosa]|uniref:Uncharacterized protein n=1 Tax=Paraphaeosphaeria sporulosa TaxID=1460663 RepID=A0A177CZ88_9PLEO|nr:uncharacterized protein CC84DRAFT_91151 [Paraphaeosphaeria sporulosa]OAG12227.1 hypothetical protein CC84DRAFT_91151 [Paraphaeosphaeria sporulosa]
MFRRRFGLTFTFCIMHLALSYIWHALPVDAIIYSLRCGGFRGPLSLVHAAARRMVPAALGTTSSLGCSQRTTTEWR